MLIFDLFKIVWHLGDFKINNKLTGNRKEREGEDGLQMSSPHLSLDIKHAITGVCNSNIKFQKRFFIYLLKLSLQPTVYKPLYAPPASSKDRGVSFCSMQDIYLYGTFKQQCSSKCFT